MVVVIQLELIRATDAVTTVVKGKVNDRWSSSARCTYSRQCTAMALLSWQWNSQWAQHFFLS